MPNKKHSKKLQRKSPHPHSKKVKASYVPLIFLVSGLLLIFLSIGWKNHLSRRLSFAFSPEITVASTTQRPTSIKITKVGIDLPIQETQIKNGVWQIAENGASHLAKSGSPGSGGNIILYAHDTNNRFGKILDLKMGDIIEIRTGDEKKHLYTVQKTFSVHPTQVEVLQNTASETLTLYTCTGFADSLRFIVQAKPFKI